MAPQPLRVSILHENPDPDLIARLERMEVRLQTDPPERIRPLGATSTDLVYVVPHSRTAVESWPDVRVRLARTGRYYVVAAREAGSAEIMKAARDGAHDVVVGEDSDQRWIQALRFAQDSQRLWWQLYGSATDRTGEILIGRSAGLHTLRDSISRLGPTDATVLILGESGTGKERVAESLHKASGAKKPFITVNCAAIPRELIEAELFGSEKGSYTGSVLEKKGLVEEASGGTLFLDEIGELDLTMQPKLLRFLETRHARRIGGTAEYASKTRVISATNVNLQQAIAAGRFRPDLYYRLSEVTLELPPLRERPDDIPDLARHFLRESSVRTGKNFESLEPELVQKFQRYGWPGNVRELKQAVDRLAILYDGPVMRAAWWEAPEGRGALSPEPPFAQASPRINGTAVTTETASPVPAANAPAVRALSRQEKYALARQLLAEGGEDLTWVAAQLGVHPTTLYRWRKSGRV